MTLPSAGYLAATDAYAYIIAREKNTPAAELRKLYSALDATYQTGATTLSATFVFPKYHVSS